MGKVIMSGIVEPLTIPGESGGSGGSGGLPTIGTPLNDFTWEQIRAISDAGQAANYFSVGDTKTIVINGKVKSYNISNLSIDVFVLGIDHNASVEGSNKIHFGLGKINGKYVAFCDNGYGNNTSGTYANFAIGDPSNPSTSTSKVGWASCHMRKTILGSDSTPDSPTANTLLAALPSDLRAVMKPVSKYSNNTGESTTTSSHVYAVTDYLPLLAEFEIFGSRTSACNTMERNSQVQYDYYKAGNSKVKYKHNATGTAAIWLTRSAASTTTAGGRFVAVSESGASSTRRNDYSSGVSPLFAV